MNGKTQYAPIVRMKSGGPKPRLICRLCGDPVEVQSGRAVVLVRDGTFSHYVCKGCLA